MIGVFLAFDRNDISHAVRTMLENSGVRVLSELKSGAELRRVVSQREYCIVLCSAALPDATADELAEDFPETVGLVVIDNPLFLANCESARIVRLPTPVRRSDLIRALAGLEQPESISRPSEEKDLINRAKAEIMSRRGLTEPQAHRYLQRISMDCCAKMTDVAKRILGEEL